MPNVTTSYRLYLGRRTRRRRRSAGQLLPVDLLAPRTNDITGTYRPVAAPFLPYRPDGGEPILCPFLFWNVRDAADGTYTRTDTSLEAPVGTTVASVTAWYRLPPGGGGGPGGDPDVEVEAFSTSLDDFVDETPIGQVDPAGAWGSGDADNVLSTAGAAVTAEVVGSLPGDSTSEFEQWVSLSPGRVERERLYEERGAAGFAIASYRQPVEVVIPPVAIPQVVIPREGYLFFGSVAIDGGGWIVGPDGRPVPIPPWEPAVLKALVASGAPTLDASSWEPDEMAKLQQVVAGQALEALGSRIRSGEVVMADIGRF